MSTLSNKEFFSNYWKFIRKLSVTRKDKTYEKLDEMFKQHPFKKSIIELSGIGSSLGLNTINLLEDDEYNTDELKTDRMVELQFGFYVDNEIKYYIVFEEIIEQFHTKEDNNKNVEVTIYLKNKNQETLEKYHVFTTTETTESQVVDSYLCDKFDEIFSPRISQVNVLLPQE